MFNFSRSHIALALALASNDWMDRPSTGYLEGRDNVWRIWRRQFMALPFLCLCYSFTLLLLFLLLLLVVLTRNEHEKLAHNANHFSNRQQQKLQSEGKLLPVKNFIFLALSFLSKLNSSCCLRKEMSLLGWNEFTVVVCYFVFSAWIETKKEEEEERIALVVVVLFLFWPK